MDHGHSKRQGVRRGSRRGLQSVPPTEGLGSPFLMSSNASYTRTLRPQSSRKGDSTVQHLGVSLGTQGMAPASNRCHVPRARHPTGQGTCCRLLKCTAIKMKLNEILGSSVMLAIFKVLKSYRGLVATNVRQCTHRYFHHRGKIWWALPYSNLLKFSQSQFPHLKCDITTESLSQGWMKCDYPIDTGPATQKVLCSC